VTSFRALCATLLIALAAVPASVGRAQAPPIAAQASASQTTAAANDTSQLTADGKKPPKSLFAEDGPVDTTWDAQVDSLLHALVRLPVAALLSAILAFRPRRRGTPKRQAPVIQTQIVLALVGAMVMMVVGASLARAFGIVGAAGLIRYRAKVDDPKDAGVMLSTLAIGLASGVGLYLFAIFATAFVLAVLLVIESIDPEPYLLFDLTITTKDSSGLKELIEQVFRRRRIPYELRGTSNEEICYEVKLPLKMRTDTISEALIGLKPAKSVDVKWEQKKDTK
jgi:MgtC family